ncbi:MAG: NFACT family protein [Lachnospiraceae bacterium]|nr:NFACT family protein [Lachnospiraceae bacterium]
MAFDGIATAALAKELSDLLTGGRINKIAQTDTSELVLTIKPMMEKGGGQVRLYLSADPSLPLCYLTEKARQAPLTAPAFCMLLRKHIQSGRIVSVTQPGLERIIRFEIEHLNEMGDLCRHILVIEIMGKHSNLIFLDENEKVVDSIRRVSSLVSSVREVLPGRDYFVPSTQGKINPLEEEEGAFKEKLSQAGADPAGLLMKTYTGLSRQMAEEILFRADLSHDRSASSMTGEEQAALWKVFSGLMEDVRKGTFSPAIYYKKTGGSQVPADFSAVPMTMYSDMERRDYPGMSSLLEAFYDQKNEVTRIRQKSADLRHIVQTILERDIHKYDLQLRQIRDTEKKDKYRVYGELLNAYGYGVPEGAKSCVLDNYYTGEKLTVPLDPRLTPQQNAKKYFDRYTKLKRTYEALSRLTVEVKAEIDHLESIRASLDLSTGEGDLAMIRREMEDAGFIRRHSDSKKGRSRTPQSRPLHYISSDGFDLYVGKNNLQNDELTFKMAAPSDIWFHANDMPGSHVILKARGLAMNDIPDRVFEEAASLAAWYSSGRAQGKVEIDYLERRDVKKPGGARPGFVVYYTNYSILANPDISMLTQAD